MVSLLLCLLDWCMALPLSTLLEPITMPLLDDPSSQNTPLLDYIYRVGAAGLWSSRGPARPATRVRVASDTPYPTRPVSAMTVQSACVSLTEHFETTAYGPDSGSTRPARRPESSSQRA